MKKKLLALSLSILLTLLFPFSAFALSKANPLTLKKYSQEESKWCWAACAQMSGKYFGYSHTQTEIVKTIKGKRVNAAATDREVELALKYAVNNKYLVAAFGVPLYSTISHMINTNHYPMIAKITWSNNKGAHVEVLTGTKKGSYVYLVDPANANQWVSYSALKKGTTLHSGTGKITRTFRFSK